MTSLYGPAEDTGASATPSGSRASMEPSGLHPTGFDPSRIEVAPLRERVRDFIYDCTKDEFNTGWTLSAHQTDDVIAMVAAAIVTEARRAETEKQGSVHEGAGPKDIAQSQPLGNPLDTGNGK